MHNEILVNANDGETRVAILERGQFVELHVERASLRSVVGNVVKGRVSRVLPGMQAAFVDIGLEKAAFLYAGDYVEDIERLESDEEEDDAPRVRRNRRGANGRRAVTDIGAILQEGQEILVQVAKEPIGTKGARITSHVSIAGRHLVLTPWSQRVGVSRRIDSDRERRRLREIVDRVRPRDLGFITRTAGEGTREADLEADVRYLTAVWDDIQIRKDQVRAPAILYSEPALPLRVVRDFANSDTRRILVDSRSAFEEMKGFVERFMAEPRPRLDLHDGPLPLFDAFGVERQVDANLGRKVWLKSGGYLIIDQSEALTAIDVNTGRYVGKRDLEETVLRTNLEAVKEVVQQLRFRNIGGLIIIDLIDMETAENREKVYRALQEAIRHDKAKTNILKISELGLVEMTRKRTRESLVQTLCEPCSYCDGRGYVLSDESVAFKVLREIRKALPRFGGRRVAVVVQRRVAEQLLGPLREKFEALEAELGREMELRARADLHQEQFEMIALEEGPRVPLELPWLGTASRPGGRGGRAAPAGAQAAPDAPEATAETTQSPEAPSLAEPDVAAAQGSDSPPLTGLTGDDAESAEVAPELAELPGGAPAAEPEPRQALLAHLGGSAPIPQALDDEGDFTILPASREREEG
jgi:ribonuclease G